jgi:hypothetical protein
MALGLHFPLERLVSCIRLQVLEAGLCVRKVVRLALALRSEASEPPYSSFGIVPAGIERRDLARVVSMVQFIHGNRPVGINFAPCCVQSEQ